MRAWAPASGWWSRPTRATAPSSSCRPTIASSPTSIPSISTTTATSTRCARRLPQFVENVPFYGFGVMCLDHPEVQALVGRIEDRRVITYGAEPAGRRALVDLGRRDGSRFAVRSATARRLTRPLIAGLELPMPGEHNAQRHRRDRRRATSSASGRGDPQGPLLRRRQAPLHPHRFVERRQIIDDYGHHPVEIGGAEGRARIDRRASSRSWCSRTATRACTTCSTISRLLQRRRHRRSSRRSMPPASADRGRQFTKSSSPASAPAAIATRASLAEPEALAPTDRRAARSRATRRLPRRRQHHAMGRALPGELGALLGKEPEAA
jgi:hypothetical protein